MKIKLFILLCLIVVSSAHAATPWCGYSEFVNGNPTGKQKVEILWIRANTCNNNYVKSPDALSSPNCNSQIANNLFALAKEPCGKDCEAAFKAIQIQDPNLIKTNPATKNVYPKIFTCQ